MYHARNKTNKIYFFDQFTLVKFPSCKLGFRRVNWFAGSPFCADFVRYQPHFKNMWSSVFTILLAMSVLLFFYSILLFTILLAMSSMSYQWDNYILIDVNLVFPGLKIKR